MFWMPTLAITAKDVQELRRRTGAGMMECKKALEQASGDMEKATELLRVSGAAKAGKRIDKRASEGLVSSYIHHNGKVGVLVEVNCESDFGERTDTFRNLVKEIALHIASAAPIAVDKDGVSSADVERERRIYEEQVRASGKPETLVGKIVDGKVEAYYKDVVLLSQPWIRDPKKTISDLIEEASAKVHERIVVRRFARFQVGAE
jgi:elongation factor Ts